MAAGFGGAGMKLEPGWHLLVGGIVVLVTGVTLLTAFLRRYPAGDSGSAS